MLSVSSGLISFIKPLTWVLNATRSLISWTPLRRFQPSTTSVIPGQSTSSSETTITDPVQPPAPLPTTSASSLPATSPQADPHSSEDTGTTTISAPTATPRATEGVRGPRGYRGRAGRMIVLASINPSTSAPPQGQILGVQPRLQGTRTPRNPVRATKVRVVREELQEHWYDGDTQPKPQPTEQDILDYATFWNVPDRPPGAICDIPVQLNPERIRFSADNDADDKHEMWNKGMQKFFVSAVVKPALNNVMVLTEGQDWDTRELMVIVRDRVERVFKEISEPDRVRRNSHQKHYGRRRRVTRFFTIDRPPLN